MKLKIKPKYLILLLLVLVGGAYFLTNGFNFSVVEVPYQIVMFTCQSNSQAKASFHCPTEFDGKPVTMCYVRNGANGNPCPGSSTVIPGQTANLWQSIISPSCVQNFPCYYTGAGYAYPAYAYVDYQDYLCEPNSIAYSSCGGTNYPIATCSADGMSWTPTNGDVCGCNSQTMNSIKYNIAEGSGGNCWKYLCSQKEGTYAGQLHYEWLPVNQVPMEQCTGATTTTTIKPTTTTAIIPVTTTTSINPITTTTNEKPIPPQKDLITQFIEWVTSFIQGILNFLNLR